MVTLDKINSAVDSIIGLFSPSAQLRRQSVRALLAEQKKRFAAGDVGDGRDERIQLQ